MRGRWVGCLCQVVGTPVALSVAVPSSRERKGPGVNAADLPWERIIVVCVMEVGALDCGTSGCLASVASLSRLRRSVRDFLADVSADCCADAVVVVDELVTNALQHGSAPVSLRLQRRRAGRRLRIEVRDGSRQMPQIGPPTTLRGRGLHLVGGLCADWGVVPTANGKTVWGEMAVS